MVSFLFVCLLLLLLLLTSCLRIEAWDSDGQNLLDYFPECNQYIENALDSGRDCVCALQAGEVSLCLSGDSISHLHAENIFPQSSRIRKIQKKNGFFFLFFFFFFFCFFFFFKIRPNPFFEKQLKDFAFSLEIDEASTDSFFSSQDEEEMKNNNE